MARGWHYTKLSLSSALFLYFLTYALCYCSFLISATFVCFCFVLFSFSHWSFVDVPLVFYCPADHVLDWQPCTLLDMVEVRSVNMNNATTTLHLH